MEGVSVGGGWREDVSGCWAGCCWNLEGRAENARVAGTSTLLRKLLGGLRERMVCRMALRHSEHTAVDFMMAVTRLKDVEEMDGGRRCDAGRFEARGNFFGSRVLMSGTRFKPERLPLYRSQGAASAPSQQPQRSIVPAEAAPFGQQTRVRSHTTQSDARSIDQSADSQRPVDSVFDATRAHMAATGLTQNPMHPIWLVLSPHAVSPPAQ